MRIGHQPVGLMGAWRAGVLGREDRLGLVLLSSRVLCSVPVNLAQGKGLAKSLLFFY